MKQIIIDIAQDGHVTIEAVGFKGGTCKDATEAIEKALGVVKRFRTKPEYHQSAGNQQSVGGGR